MQGRPTIRDVAQRAGVSPTTVSHVLSGRGRVAVETCRRVEAAAEDLGYQPHPGARSLRTERFGSFGLLLPGSVTNYDFYAELAMGAASAAFERECSITLISPRADAREISRLPIDALLVADPGIDDERLAQLPRGLPVVACERTDGATPFVDLGHEAALAELLDHLVQNGARVISALRPPVSVWWGLRVEEGLRLWSERHADIEVRIVEMPFAADAGKVLASLQPVMQTRPDAVVVMQEGVSAVVLSAAEAHGLRVPEDLLVAVGVDGRDARFSSVPVTAIDLAPRECGESAVSLAMGEIEGGIARTSPTLVVRSSTARA